MDLFDILLRVLRLLRQPLFGLVRRVVRSLVGTVFYRRFSISSLMSPSTAPRSRAYSIFSSVSSESRSSTLCFLSISFLIMERMASAFDLYWPASTSVSIYW